MVAIVDGRIVRKKCKPFGSHKLLACEECAGRTIEDRCHLYSIERCNWLAFIASRSHADDHARAISPVVKICFCASDAGRGVTMISCVIPKPSRLIKRGSTSWQQPWRYENGTTTGQSAGLARRRRCGSPANRTRTYRSRASAS